MAAPCLAGIVQFGLKSNEISVRFPLVKERIAESTTVRK